MRGAIAVFALLLLSAWPGFGAVGLGDLTVKSELGERFWAELPLVGRDFAVELEVSFGGHEDYIALGLERKEVVDDIVPLFSIEEDTRIYLYSVHEVREASFDLIVKVNTSEGAVSRAYHIELAEEGLAHRPSSPAYEEDRAPRPAFPMEKVLSAGLTPKHPYVIHVASYREPALDRRQVEELRAHGEDAFIALTRVPGKGLFYRVLVGRYPTYQEAMENASRLKQVEKLPYHAPLELPYSVGIEVSSREAAEQRGFAPGLIPGLEVELAGHAFHFLAAYATYEEAAAVSEALTKNGIPACVVTP